MSAAFTSGPWIVIEQNQELQIWQHRVNGKMLERSCVAITNGQINDLARADAQLIAAAPELLQACQAFMNYRTVAELDVVVGLVREAIAKATGASA